MTKEINLGKLAFYWRMTNTPNTPPNPVPDFVDFSFEFIEDYQLIIQKRNSQTWEYLETIYKENYNVGYLQEGHDLAEGYGNDFLNYINFAVQNFRPQAKRISEIGAGGCYILNKLRAKGYNVAAIDPSPIAINKGKELGIEVIADFYPAKNSIPKSDLIIHYDVLEHVTDPASFVKHHSNDLEEGGLIVFAVPDCTSYINSGDISMILHEHLNYYDTESLRNVVEAGGFKVLDVRKADYGGVLYCIATPGKNNTGIGSKGTEKFENFRKNYEALHAKVNAFITEATGAGTTLGCYIPLRAIPYLSGLSLSGTVRFFDDNSGIYNQYFDGFAIPVENRKDLINKPVTHLLIMSAAFGSKIKDRINAELPGNQINIKCLNDFLD